MKPTKNSFLSFSRRKVQIALGLLWLLDGALQLQHQMFSSNFATQVIAPAAQGQPRFISGVMNFGIHLFLLHPAIFNGLFAATQLGIGLLILRKDTVNLGLRLSIIWGLVVWVTGEGYGGIFTGHTLLLMGAPGAALLYVLLALAVLPTRAKDKNKKVHAPAYWLALVWLILWLGGGIYQLLPGQNSTADLSAMVAANAISAPHWLATLDNHVANSIEGLGSGQVRGADTNMHMTNAQMVHMTSQSYNPAKSNSGYLFILAIAGLQFFIALGVLRAGIVRRLAIGLGILLALIFWVVGQSLGGYYTGLATDPNSGPLLVLLALAILGVAELDQKLSKLGSSIENRLV